MNEVNYYMMDVHLTEFQTKLSADMEYSSRERDLRRFVNQDDPVYTEEDPEREEEQIRWFFGEVDDDYVGYNGNTWVLGEFGKEFTAKPTIYDEKEGVFIDDEAVSTEADRSQFVLDLTTGLIVFNQRNHVGHEEFRTAFVEGFNDLDGFARSMTAEFLKNTATLNTIVSDSEVTKAEFTISDHEEVLKESTESFLNLVRQTDSSSLELNFENDGGLTLDTEVVEGLRILARSEAGEYKITYIDENGDEAICRSKSDKSIKRKEPSKTLGGMKESADELIRSAEKYA